MPATITWTVTQMDCYPQADNETDVVFNVHWTCSGIQLDNDVEYSGSIINVCPVTYTSDRPFIPYAELTQQQVLGWIWTSGVDQAATEAAVQQQIDQKISPPVVSPPLPWAQQ